MRSPVGKNQSPRKTGGSDTHHSHLEEVVTTLRNLHWEILEDSCKFPLSLARLGGIVKAPIKTAGVSFGASTITITHTLR